MNRFASAVGLLPEPSGPLVTVSRGPCSTQSCILYVEGPFRFPVTPDLRAAVRTALRQGIRRLEVDLTGVPRIDAAGVGELVRAYNMTAAAAGVLQIRNTTPWVRHVLELVGLFTVLSEGEPLPG
jgi:anti-anti-sigma factor